MSEQLSEIKYPVKENIADAMEELVEDYFSKHSKVLVVRFDITYPVAHGDVKDNGDIQKCMSNTMKGFKRKGYDPAYGWVMEKKASVHPHYHGLALLDGQKTRSADMVFDKVEKNWQSVIGSDSKGLIDHCMENNGIRHENGLVINTRDGIPDYVHRQINYIAKPEDKANPKDGLRDFGRSRLGKKNKK